MSQRRTALLSTAIATPLALAAPATLAQGMSHPCGPKSTQPPNPIAHACGQGHTSQRRDRATIPLRPPGRGEMRAPKVNVETTPPSPLDDHQASAGSWRGGGSCGIVKLGSYGNG